MELTFLLLRKTFSHLWCVHVQRVWCLHWALTSAYSGWIPLIWWMNRSCVFLPGKVWTQHGDCAHTQILLPLVLQALWLPSFLRWKWLEALWTDPQGRIWVWFPLLGWHLRLWWVSRSIYIQKPRDPGAQNGPETAVFYGVTVTKFHSLCSLNSKCLFCIILKGEVHWACLLIHKQLSSWYVCSQMGHEQDFLSLFHKNTHVFYENPACMS